MSAASISSNEDDAIVISRDDISNYNPEQILPELPEDIEKIRKWLEPTNYAQEGGEFHRHLQSHMPGTSDWLITSEPFRTWQSSNDQGLLWIKGIPGAGKSVFASFIIDTLAQSNPGSPTLYFFFRQIIDANHEPAAMLRDWLDQILNYSPPLQKQLKELVETRRSLSSLSMEDLWNYLRLALRSLPGKVFCVADALDEMDEGNDKFLQSLAALGCWKPDKVKLLFTSRPVPRLEVPLRHIEMIRVRLEEKMVDADISSYVEHGLIQSSHISLDERDQIRKAVPGRANGIFLYAKLAMDAFLEPGAHIAEVLRNLPADLHELYTGLLHEHALRSGVPHDIQLLILQWVTHATRPLRLLEIAEMISVTYTPSHCSDDKQDLASTKELVRAAAGPLLEILPNETVCVIHHSFTEYLKCVTRSELDGGYPVLRYGVTHGQLALACLKYLQAGCLDSIQVLQAEDEDEEDSDALSEWSDSGPYRRAADRNKEEQRIRLQHPFFAYATSNWQLHVARSCAGDLAQDDINTALDSFLGNVSQLKAWLKYVWSNDDTDFKRVTPLHVAARYGLTEYAASLISKHANISATDMQGKSPLWWAATSGHASIIRLLVQAGANPNLDDRVVGLTPLHKAASKNHAAAVRVLLEAGVDPLTPKTRENPGRRCGNAPRSVGHTPLMYACHYGHLEALEAFLPFLKDIDVVHRALAWSADRGRSKLVKRILQHPGVEVNAKVRGDTALYLACRNTDYDTIVALLDAGADPKILCSHAGNEFGGMGSMHCFYPGEKVDKTRGYTALNALCSIGRRAYGSANNFEPELLHDLFDRLVEDGVDIEQRTKSGQTLLHAALNSPILVRLLLQAGADANARDDNGQAPLHLVTSVDSISLFIEEGKADVDAINQSDGRSPLLCKLAESNEPVISKLLEYKPNLLIRDKKGDGVLHIALSKYSTDTTIIERLLAAGADPNERNRAGETPLLMMRMDNRDSTTTLDLLLNAGADINAKDTKGMTILSRLMRSYSSYSTPQHSDISALIQRGADPQVRDHCGRTLLHRAAAYHEGRRDHDDEAKVTRFDFVLGLGLDVQALDYRGNTILHELALRSGMLDSYEGPRYIALWEQLLALGVDVNQANYSGRTVLHLLASTRPNSTTWKCNLMGPLDFVISRVGDIDQRDHLGLSALHLASTVSEYATKKLLDAGADLTSTSFDLLSPVHLAARTRQSNILGLLLVSNKDSVESVVNLKDAKGHTPLYYACRSGTLETVTLLLEAGADASHKTLFDACAKFGDEQKLWDIERHLADTEKNIDASGLTTDDASRPPFKSNDNYRWGNLDVRRDVPRLEEILRLLTSHGCDMTNMKYDPRNMAIMGLTAEPGHAYTYSCLLRASEGYMNEPSPEECLTSIISVEESVVRASEDAYTDASAKLESKNTRRTDIGRHLHRRQYQVMKALFNSGVEFLDVDPANKGQSFLDFFVGHGYAALLDEIGSLEAERQLKTGVWHAHNDMNTPGLYKDNSTDEAKQSDDQPVFLLTALEREEPNMEVVRLLVEKFHVDVNQCRYKNTYVDGKYELLPQDSALHYLARGTRWWHTALALPYLISKGADMNALNFSKLSPLQIALGGPESYVGIFNRDAVRVLVSAGANLVTPGQKESCLAGAIGDMKMIRLLLDHGAPIHADALLTAINNKKVGALSALLEAGADPNLRKEPVEAPKKSRNKRSYWAHDDFLPHEIYPLYAAATKHRRKEVHEAIQMMEALLSHGASPYAVFKIRNRKYDDEISQDVDDEGVKDLYRRSDASEEYLDVTVLHDLLDQDHLVHPILSLPDLDPNHRDAKGRTLAHMVCHNHSLRAPIDAMLAAHKKEVKFNSSMPSFLDCLLTRGADLLATDHYGQNILHHLFENSKRSKSDDQSLSHLVQLAEDYPSLLNQADIDGKTPLHASLRYSMIRNDMATVEALLGAGADPFATDTNGNGCLHLLAFRIYSSAGARSLFSKLLSRGLDINRQNRRGETPVFNLNRQFHSINCNLEVCIDAAEALSIFEKAGADLFAKDSAGRGLLHIAAKEIEEPPSDYEARLDLWSSEVEQEPDIARFQVLMRKGLDPMMEDNQKRTALDIAAACGKESVLKLFEKDGANGTKRIVATDE